MIGVEAAIRIFGAGIDNVAPVSGKTEPVSPRLLDDDAQQVVLENVVTFAAAGQWALQQVVAAIGFAHSRPGFLGFAARVIVATAAIAGAQGQRHRQDYCFFMRVKKMSVHHRWFPG